MTGPDEPDLREAVLSGVRWVVAARVAGEVLGLAASVALARMIAPAEFGRAAIALIASALALTVVPSVAATRLVQRRDAGESYFQAGAALGLLAGAALTVATWLAAPVGSALLDERTEDLIRLASPVFLLWGIGAVSSARLERALDFRAISIANVAGALAGPAVAVTLAALGHDAEAIVIGMLAGTAATVLALTVAAPPPRPRWRRSEVRDIAGFGLPTALGKVGNVAYRNVDYAIVAARLGAHDLGAYWRAYQLGTEYQGKISQVMLGMAFPVYSRTRDVAEMRRIRSRVVRTHAAVIFPLLAVLIASAPALIPFVYGEAWEAAVVPTQILAVAGMAAAVFTGVGPLLSALGHPGRMAAWTVLATPVYALVIYLVAPQGLTAVCIAVVVFVLVFFVLGHYLLLTRTAGIPMRSLVDEVGPPLLASAAAVAVALPLGSVLLDSVPDPVVVAAVAVAGLAVYAAALRGLSRAAWDDVTTVGRRLVGRAA